MQYASASFFDRADCSFSFGGMITSAESVDLKIMEADQNWCKSTQSWLTVSFDVCDGETLVMNRG
jgi:hypothetical protein